LKAALKHPEYWVRQSAAEVLSKIGEGNTGETQFEAFTDAAQHRRRSAVSVNLEVLNEPDRD
jgi:HEAT repeat protein